MSWARRCVEEPDRRAQGEFAGGVAVLREPGEATRARRGRGQMDFVSVEQDAPGGEGDDEKASAARRCR